MRKPSELLNALQSLARKADRVEDLIEEATWDSKEWGVVIKANEVVKAIQELREEVAMTETTEEGQE